MRTLKFFDIQLPERLKGLRKSAGMDLASVAHRTRIPTSTLHAYETGERPPTIAALKKLAKFYQVHLIVHVRG